MFENAKVKAFHGTLLENGEPGYDQDFIVVMVKVEGWSDGKPYYIVTLVDDEHPESTAHWGEMSPKETDCMIRELVTGSVYRRDEPEYDATLESITYRQISA